MAMWEKAKTSCQAKVVGSALVAVFDVSDPPMVWQFDLDKNPNVAFSVVNRGERWALGVTVAPAAFQPIVQFEDVASADEALAAVYRALSCRKIGGRVRGCGPWAVSGILGAVLLTGLIYFFAPIVDAMLFGDLMKVSVQQTQAPAAQQAVPEAKKEMPIGVPVSADEFLKTPSSEGGAK